jgi:hypothetical protein
MHKFAYLVLCFYLGMYFTHLGLNFISTIIISFFCCMGIKGTIEKTIDLCKIIKEQ